MKDKSRTTIAVMMSLLMFFATAADVMGFTINTGNYQEMSTYPGIRTFDYSKTPIRENIDAESMVEPEYTFRVEDRTIDEFFGTVGTYTNGSVSYRGCYLNKNTKGQCGVRYNRLFRYQDEWIDVKTTYMDWSVVDKNKAFVNGGFCRVRWTNVNYVRLRHEFFKSGTNEPVSIKGFFTYTDVDNNQGIGLIPEEVRNLWTNRNGSILKYKITTEGYLFVKDSVGATVPGPGSDGYTPAKAAKAMFSYTFEGATHDQFILDGNSDDSRNTISFEDSKVIPSGIPDPETGAIKKEVSTDGDEFGTENELRSWNAEWQYRVAALLPLETEEGNFLDAFSITDQIDPCLEITGVKILRGGGTDVTDQFEIDIDNNRIEASAVNTHDPELCGYTYYMLVDVRIGVDEDALREHGHFIDAFKALVKNKATVTYADGNGTYDRETNETETTIIFPYNTDITITKRIMLNELYWPHGVPSFIIRLNGTEKESGEEVEYNKVITFTPDYVEAHKNSAGYVERSVVFHGIGEGTYRCDEYPTTRYRLDRITDIQGGSAEQGGATGLRALFKVNDDSPRKATFVNLRKRWDQYSDSRCVVNEIGDN